MSKGFCGFPQEGLDFLKALQANNRREWFQPRKEAYEELVKAPMTLLVEDLNARLAKFAPRHITDPKKAIYRIYRDTRFSKDKLPYKTNIAASFPASGAGKRPVAGFYCGVGTDGVEVGGGIYMPGPDDVRMLRTHIAEHHERLRRILADSKLKKRMGGLVGEQLTRPPKGFAADHPGLEFLRYKHWILYHTEIEVGIATSRELTKRLGSCFESMVEFVGFLNEPLLRSIPVRDPLPR